jgi:hypothetical protein
MAAGAPKVILVICSDRTIQASLRTVIEDAGCQAAFSADVGAGRRQLARTTPILILTDPLLALEVMAALAGSCPVVEFPVRTSSTGVSRMAKRNDAGVKWLSELIESHCANQ